MRRSLVAVLAAAGIAGIALGQEPGLSPIFTANSYTTGTQDVTSVAAAADTGNFVIVWTSFGQEGTAGRGVFGRRFDPLGNPFGMDFQANTYTFVDQVTPRVASDDAGNFVVVWGGTRDDDANGIAARRYDAGGSPLTPNQDPVHAATLLVTEQDPAVARNDTHYVVVWQSLASPGDLGWEIQGRLFESDGDAVAPPFSVNTYVNGDQTHPQVAIDAAGSFLVAWQSAETGSDIRARAYDAGGAPLGNDFVVNTDTNGFQYNFSVATDGAGGFVVAWNDNAISYPMKAQRIDASGNLNGPETPIGNGEAPKIARRADGGYGLFYNHGANIFGGRLDDGLVPSGAEFQINDPAGLTPYVPSLAANAGRHFVFAWSGIPGGDIHFRRGGFPEWAPYGVDERAPTSGAPNQNGVAEANERFTVDAALSNLSGSAYTLSGTASNFTGPAGPVYTIHDSSADYGTLAGFATGAESPGGSTAGDCFTASGNCYEFEIAGNRPPGTPHWDATYDEALSEEVSITRTLHVGGSFTDVPAGNLFYRFIETLFHTGVTGGCGGSLYCPSNPVTRAQMAVFLLKSKFGATFVPPPATGTVFTDVPVSHPFAPWIEHLAALGITGGCAPGLYCPDASVNRQQMAVFLLKTEEGSGYTPPAAAGIFQDVPLGNPFVAWVEELYSRQITGGCSVAPLLYCPTNSVTRGQMSAFLTKTFLLALYGP